MIDVIATVEPRPGTRDAFLAEFAMPIAPVRAEDGCIGYGPAIDAEIDIPVPLRNGPDDVVAVEKWRTLPALETHSMAPQVQAYRPRVKDYFIAMRLQVLQPAA